LESDRYEPESSTVADVAIMVGVFRSVAGRRETSRCDVEPVKQLNAAAIERAVITLERAFASDPMFTWMFPDPRQRSRSLRVFLRVPLQYGLRYGHVTESNGGMAVAIWLPPGRTITARWDDPLRDAHRAVQRRLSTIRQIRGRR
jgi:hypothetical protein